MSRKTQGQGNLGRVLLTVLQRLVSSHLTIQREVRIAFVAMLVAASIALLAVIGGVAGVYLGEIQVGLVLAVADVMSGTITVLLWRQYKHASQRMRQCQQDLHKLLLLMVAFEIAESMKDFQQQDVSKEAIITGILSR